MKNDFLKLTEEAYRKKQSEIENNRINLLEYSKTHLFEYFKELQIDELYITGSLITPNKFSNRSDIDIAVSNLGEELYFKTISELEDLFKRKVEIIELENCKFADKIRSTGLKLL